MANNKDSVDNKCPKKCVGCEYRQIITCGVVPYNFCSKLGVSFSGGEPNKFFSCGK